MGFPDEYFFEEGCYISEWLNRREDPAVSIVRARLPAGATTRWHVLNGVTERYLILAGEGLAEYAENQQAVEPGDVITIAPGARQRIQNTGSSDLVFLAVCTPRFTAACYQDVEDRAG